MIPSRGIARSLPSGITSGPSISRLSGRTFATRSIPSRRNAAIFSGHGTRARLSPVGTGAAAPIALGSVAASRNLSLWGWGGGSSSKTSEQAAEEANRAATAAAAEQQHAASSATDAATDNISAAPSLTEPTTAAAQPPPLAGSDLSDFGGTSGLSAADLLDLSPNEPGYLQALGLDNGWGPTTVMQWVLEHVHLSMGLGWGASIVASAFALRAAMLVPHILQMRNGGRVAHMQADPRAVEMNRLTKESLADGVNGMEKRQQAKVLADLLKKEYGVNNWNLLWLVVQFPFTIGLFKLVRQMGNLPVPGMEEAGFMWFTDLTVRDPLFILPALATGVMIMSLQIGQKYMAEAQKKMMKPMAWALGGIGFVFTSFLTAGVNVMGLAFASATLLTSLILETPVLRRKFGLLMGPPPSAASAAKAAAPPSATAAAAASSIPAHIPKGIRYEAPRRAGGAAPAAARTTTAEEVVKPLTLAERLNNSLSDAKQGMSQQLGSFGGRMAATDAEKAERNRKELMKKLEDKRQQQERDEFSRKYKGKK
ncbi:mitochondrial export translocase Oxa1, putative [Cordyceps militaris CM01]|uniref:Mitochondrial export translocase Oxa1, putative n=1 Tax=Cordyceps militaris (strain CM01) TaxID=983644 RepID=G3JP83_CORMM|nr:mitochondrial export translocase Oxa1, putative [Cordyceps militaris CM01]EGX89693.1 mitochondrial export translocase Oxa1, putative [Cordyceps militaris CM01]